MVFGKKASEYERERAEQGDEVWIKSFRDGETKVRILEEPDDMVTYREHFADGFGYFPCSEESDCIGCKDPDKKVQTRSRRYAFNAIDSQERLQVYKMGTKLHRSFKIKAQRLGTVTDRDYTIIRTGENFQNIDYDTESSEKYELSNVPDRSEWHDIGEILENKYKEAVAAYAGVVTTSELAEPEPEKPARSVVKPKPKPEPEQVEVSKTPAADEAQSSGSPAGPEFTKADYPDIDELDNSQLREYLRDPRKELPELPERAPRGRMVTVAKKWQLENPPFSG